MRNTRMITRWLAATLVLVASVALASPPRQTTPAQVQAASLRRLNLSGTPAALPAALLPLAGGQRANASRVNAAQGGAVSGAPGQPGRIVVPLGDVDGDSRSDLLDVRASRGTLSAQLVSGRIGITRWRMTPISHPADVYAAVFPATIKTPNDFYLLEQFDFDAKRTWTIHAINGATGARIWVTSGSIPTGVSPSATTPPSVPPSVPPVSPTSPPTALPTTPPTGVPSALPTPGGAPSAIPTNLATAVPTVLPTGTPPVPGIPPTPLPSPTVTPPGVPSALPSAAPVATPTITPPAGAGSAQRAGPAQQQQNGEPFAGYATGARPVDVDADGKADFPITQTLAMTLADGATLVVSQLTTVSAVNGQSIANVAAAGVNALPYAGVAGDVLGRPGLVAVDEVAGASNAVATYRMHTGAGTPVWASAGTVPLGTMGLFDARADLTGDGTADLLAARMPTVTGQQDTTLSVFASPLGSVAWTKAVPDSAIVLVGGAIDAVGGADVLTQGLDLGDAGKIPSAVIYRALSGATGTTIYENRVPIRAGGMTGDWLATLSSDAGRVDGDQVPDLYHAVHGIPASAASEWSQGVVGATTGRLLWSKNTPLNPGLPVGGNILGDAAADIVDVQESATRTSDSLVVRASSGSSGSQLWSSRVLVGGGTERVRSLAAQATDPGATGDIVITVVQRSGSGSRSLIVAVKGSTGQVLWIRTT